VVDKLLRLFDSWVFRIRGFCGFSSGIWFLGMADVLNFTVPARHICICVLYILPCKQVLYILHAHKRFVGWFVSVHLPFLFLINLSVQITFIYLH
jgi:hypothetical protein